MKKVIFLPRRRSLRRLLFWAIAIVWFLYLPVHPYYPYCDYAGSWKRSFGPSLSTNFRRALKSKMNYYKMPYLEIGTYIFVPLFEWTDEISYWSNLNSRTVTAVGVNAKLTKPDSLIARLHVKYWKTSFDDNATFEDKLRDRCNVVEAVVTPLDQYWENGP
jgi:hypothetical protein